jgi:hypothetical protein
MHQFRAIRPHKLLRFVNVGIGEGVGHDKLDEVRQLEEIAWIVGMKTWVNGIFDTGGGVGIQIFFLDELSIVGNGLFIGG